MRHNWQNKSHKEDDGEKQENEVPSLIHKPGGEGIGVRPEIPMSQKMFQ